MEIVLLVPYHLLGPSVHAFNGTLPLPLNSEIFFLNSFRSFLKTNKPKTKREREFNH